MPRTETNQALVGYALGEGGSKTDPVSAAVMPPPDHRPAKPAPQWIEPERAGSERAGSEHPSPGHPGPERPYPHRAVVERPLPGERPAAAPMAFTNPGESLTAPAAPAEPAPVGLATAGLAETFAASTTPANLDLPTDLPRPRRSRMAVKSGLDRLCGAALLVPALPVITACALAVKLTSRGPVLYSQIRSGLDGRPFRMYKIRSMYHDCEAQTGAVWAKRMDSRVTPVGALLRETHLDELPQLFNVIRGEMSLIGPRPERPEIVERLNREIPGYQGRLAVRPGLTGLAQVELPPDTDLDDVRNKLAYDLHYVRRVGLRLDVCIFLCTMLHIMGLTLIEVGRLLVRPCRKAVMGNRGNPAATTTPTETFPTACDLPPVSDRTEPSPGITENPQ